jgi:ribosomal protein S18 acetylase RimI-like enzyme
MLRLRRPAETSPRPAVAVRDATPGDADSVARLARLLSLADGARPSQFTAEAYLRDGFGPQPAFRVLVAEVDGSVAGYALFYPGYDTDRATRGVYLADLYVLATHRRMGVGRALVCGVARAARAMGGSWMFWSVLKRNRGARRFYRTLAPELRDIVICAAFGPGFEKLARDG